MKKCRVVFLHGLQPATLQLILSAFPGDYEVMPVEANASEDVQIEAVAQADFLMIYRAKPSDKVLASGKKLRFVQLLAAGYDDLNIALLQAQGIPCANNGGSNSWAVADQALLFILALYRRFRQADHDVRSGRWNVGISGVNTFELAGKTVGILGLGNIGKQVARRVQAFDAKVYYFNPRRLSPEQEQALGVEHVSLDALFRTSDILSLHAPLTDATRHIVNKDTLSVMKPSAILINTSRGALVDEVALAHALSSGRIAGAGLDAFDKEPVDAANPLLQLDNVALSPHSGGTTADTWRRRGDFAYQNIERVLAGHAPDSLIKSV
jgi:phosphoglycerate dehydrogenase-like enzyme